MWLCINCEASVIAQVLSLCLQVQLFQENNSLCWYLDTPPGSPPLTLISPSSLPVLHHPVLTSPLSRSYFLFIYFFACSHRYHIFVLLPSPLSLPSFPPVNPHSPPPTPTHPVLLCQAVGLPPMMEQTPTQLDSVSHARTITRAHINSLLNRWFPAPPPMICVWCRAFDTSCIMAF